jgi:hypothetical protein
MSTNDDDGGTSTRVVPGRACGTCTMCCKLTKIDAVQKPAGIWCRHCKPGKGCTIYATRPNECRQFFCAWMTMPGLGDEWKPTQSKMVVAVHGKNGSRMTVHVDPQRPDAWRAEPYHMNFRRWAKTEGMTILVAVGSHYYTVLPDRDVDLGIVGPDEMVLIEEHRMPYGVELTPVKVRKDDPRAQAFLAREAEG